MWRVGSNPGWVEPRVLESTSVRGVLEPKIAIVFFSAAGDQSSALPTV